MHRLERAPQEGRLSCCPPPWQVVEKLTDIKALPYLFDMVTAFDVLEHSECWLSRRQHVQQCSRHSSTEAAGALTRACLAACCKGRPQASAHFQ